MANSGLLIVGAVVLIVLVVFGSTIITAATGIFATLNADVASFFKSLQTGLGFNNTSPTPTPSSSSSPSPTASVGNAAAVSWFAFTLHFSDGTSQDLNMNPSFSIFPLSITWQGKTLSSLDCFIRLKVTGDNLGAWSTTASQHIEVYFNGATTPATSSTGSFVDSGNSWISGQAQSVQTTTLSAAQLQAVFNQYGQGTWVFQTTGSVALSITSNDQLQQLSAVMDGNDITLNSNTLSVSSLTASHLTTFQLTPR